MVKEILEYCAGLRTDLVGESNLAVSARSIMGSGLPEPQKRMKAMDTALLKLIYRKEYLLLQGREEEASKLSSMIEEFKDYPWLISEKSGADLKALSPGISRLVLLVTHSCQLRCSYCSVGKYRAEMGSDVMRKAVDLLFTSKKEDVQLQFFGGEPLLNLGVVKEAVEYASGLCKKTGKNVRFILTTNGIALTEEIIKYLMENDFLVEFSFDGKEETQMKYRSGVDHYGILLENLRKLRKSGVRYQVISVVTPENVSKAAENLLYIRSLGLDNLQLNYALGNYWSEDDATELESQLTRAMKEIDKATMVNAMKQRREPVVLNAEVTVDCDGSAFLETGICLEEDFATLKKDFYIGSVEDMEDIDLIFPTRSRNLYRLVEVYTKGKQDFRKIILNNIDMGVRMRRFFKDE